MSSMSKVVSPKIAGERKAGLGTGSWSARGREHRPTITFTHIHARGATFTANGRSFGAHDSVQVLHVVVDCTSSLSPSHVHGVVDGGAGFVVRRCPSRPTLPRDGFVTGVVPSNRRHAVHDAHRTGGGADEPGSFHIARLSTRRSFSILKSVDFETGPLW